MIPAHHSPATPPSLAQQKDALQKGLGRAMLWAMAGELDETALLDACLHDKRFDPTVNEYRGDWLWQMVQSLHAEGRFWPMISEALRVLAEDNAKQVCELGYHYAANGDDAFRSRLYQIVEEKPLADADLRWLGEEEIIRLDGEEALLLAVRLRGRQLANRDWEWDDSVFMDESIERLGEDRVKQSLEAASDQASRRFREAWIGSKSESEPATNPRLVHGDKKKQIPAADIIAAAESPEAKYPYLLGWGRWANDNELEKVFERLLSSREPRIIANYLKVFARREFPRIVPELVSLSQHNNPEVRRRAITALENSSHALVRELAEHELKNGVSGGLALGLFVKNYWDGDEQRIIDLAELPEDAGEQHWLLRDATKVLEQNPKADCSQLAVAAYALIPCGFCRYFAARLLRDRQVAPPWLIEECRFDSEPDTRKVFIEP